MVINLLVCLQFLTSLEAIGGLWCNWWKQSYKISSGNIWQPSKKPKKRSTFAYFMVAVHEATVSGRHLLWKTLRPSCLTVLGPAV